MVSGAVHASVSRTMRCQLAVSFRRRAVVATSDLVAGFLAVQAWMVFLGFQGLKWSP